MADILEFFGPSGFMQRGHCGDWSVIMVSLYVLSNIALAIGYFVIGGTLLVAGRHRMLPLSYVTYMCFAGVFFLCGLMHFVDGCLSFVWPMYHLHAVIYAIQAVLVIITAGELSAALRALFFSAEYDEAHIAGEVETADSLRKIQALAASMSEMMEGRAHGP